jgi:hypothetical protein
VDDDPTPKNWQLLKVILSEPVDHTARPYDELKGSMVILSKVIKEDLKSLITKFVAEVVAA